MPELPEVETVVRTIRPFVVGRRILGAEFRSRFVTPGDRDDLALRLAGRKINTVRRRGKFILLELDRGFLSIHLGMTGKLLAGGSITTHTHGILQLDNGTLLYEDARQFGRIELDDDEPARASRLGVEPFDLSAIDFAASLKKRNTAIKPLLLNQRFLAGLGNIYVDESLFRAGIHPLTKAARLTRERATRLLRAIVETLNESIEAGGSSISDYVDAHGQQGDFQNRHKVYGREGKPCTLCGTAIQRKVVAQRGTHFCPACQKRF